MAVEVEDGAEAEEEEVLEVEIGMREGKLRHVLIAERKVTGPEIVRRVEVLGMTGGRRRQSRVRR